MTCLCDTLILQPATILQMNQDIKEIQSYVYQPFHYNNKENTKLFSLYIYFHLDK